MTLRAKQITKLLLPIQQSCKAAAVASAATCGGAICDERLGTVRSRLLQLTLSELLEHQMIKKLFSIFAKEPAAARRIQKNKPFAGTPYRAVAVIPGQPCCETSKIKRHTKILMRTAPALPLAHCSMRQRCTCRYEKYEDRRESQRRSFGLDTQSTWYSDKERRQSKGRRNQDGS